MGKRADNSDRGVMLTGEAVRRIGAAVQSYEHGNRNQPPIKFRTAFQDNSAAVRLGKASEDIKTGAVGQVALWRDPTADEESCLGPCDPGGFLSDSQTVCAQNLIRDVKAGDWVYVTQPSGRTWHIIACPQSAGSDTCGRTARRLLPLSFSASFGKGAFGMAVAPNNCPGPIQSVNLDVAGCGYAKLEGDPPTVSVAEVTVSIAQIAPSNGSGAEITATVDDDPDSATFGQITSVTLVEPGDDYVNLGWEYRTKHGGVDFSTVSGYDGSKKQILGHEVNGCLKWYDVVECDAAVPPGVCCVDGVVDPDYQTQSVCEENGGTWKANASTDDLPGPCCE